jgi:hypothetical protein
MNRQRGPRAVVLSVAALALLSLAACGDAAGPSASLLPRDTLVPVSVVTQYFPDVTEEASTGPNETSVGKPIASRSVVFASADGKKKVTVSVDQYASASDAAAAYQTAVQGARPRPGSTLRRRLPWGRRRSPAPRRSAPRCTSVSGHATAG